MLLVLSDLHQLAPHIVQLRQHHCLRGGSRRAGSNRVPVRCCPEESRQPTVRPCWAIQSLLLPFPTSLWGWQGQARCNACLAPGQEAPGSHLSTLQNKNQNLPPNTASTRQPACSCQARLTLLSNSRDSICRYSLSLSSRYSSCSLQAVAHPVARVFRRNAGLALGSYQTRFQSVRLRHAAQCCWLAPDRKQGFPLAVGGVEVPAGVRASVVGVEQKMTIGCWWRWLGKVGRGGLAKRTQQQSDR